jgi:sugar lactone lactonase YvrE
VNPVEPQSDPRCELLWDAECDLAESPVWDPVARRVLFCANGAGPNDAGADGVGSGRILGFDVDDGTRHEWRLPGPVGSFGRCASGRLIVALARQIVFLDLVTGEVTALTGELAEPPGNQFNDGRPGPDGCYWVGTRDARRSLQLGPGTTVPDPNGGLYRIGPDGSAACVTRGFLSSNGLAFSPDGGTLYYSDSANNLVDAWDFGHGRLSARRRFASLTPAIGKPDGAAVDEEGCYWSAGVSSARVNRFGPDGRLLSAVSMPCPAPTMPCFADGYLYVTSMRGIHREAASSLSGLPYPIAGLFRLPAPVNGAPVAVFNDQ